MFTFFFWKIKNTYEISASIVGAEWSIRDCFPPLIVVPLFVFFLWGEGAEGVFAGFVGSGVCIRKRIRTGPRQISKEQNGSARISTDPSQIRKDRGGGLQF